MFFIITAFQHYGVEKEEWEKKLVGFGSDGASVNVGVRAGVATRLKDRIPHLVAIHCIAHRLELGVLDAIKEDPLLQECLQMLYRYKTTVLSCEHRNVHRAF